MTMMTTTPQAADTTPAAVTRRFLSALARRDFSAVEATFFPGVWMRAMLVRETRETHDHVGALAALREWFAHAEDLEVCELEQATVEGRQRVRWQFVLRPDWAPGTLHRIEQVGYVTVRLGRITRLDVVCTGFHPVPDRPPRAEEPQ